MWSEFICLSQVSYLSQELEVPFHRQLAELHWCNKTFVCLRQLFSFKFWGILFDICHCHYIYCLISDMGLCQIYFAFINF